MLFPDTTIAQMKTLSNESLHHSCVITDPSGTVYSGSAQVYADEVQIHRMAGGDASFDAEAIIRLPHQSHEDWSRKIFDQDSAKVKATYEGVVQTGRIRAVMRKQTMCFVAVNWTDEGAPESTLGTINDLIAMEGNARVVLVWSEVKGAVSYRAKKDGVLYGSATTETAIEVTGLVNATEYDFVVVATDADGSSTTSNLVSATPSA